MIELNIVELVGVMLGTGATTGGVTIAGLRVHINYLREADRRHEVAAADYGQRLGHLERETDRANGTAQRAHERIDALEARLS